MVSEDPLFQEFLLLRSPLNQSTIKSYTWHLNKYSQFTGLTPTELIEEAETDEREGVEKRKRRIKKHLLGFYQHLQDQGHTPLTIRSTLTTIRSFYRELDIEVPRLKIKTKPQTREGAEEIPNADHIRRALEISNTKYRAIIMLAASSGMGSAEFRSLKIKDLLQAVNAPPEVAINGSLDTGETGHLLPRKEVPCWRIRRVKTGMPYFTFSTPESIRAILIYLGGEDPRDLEDYLFPGSTPRDRMHGVSIGRYFRKISRRCGFPEENGRVFFHAHALRKFFATTLTRANLAQIKTDWLLGHSINQTTEAYFKPTVEGLRVDYLNLMPFLSFEEKVRVRIVTDERLQELEARDLERETRLQRLEALYKAKKEYEKMKEERGL